MNGTAWLLDGIIAGGLPFVAWRLVRASTVRSAVVLFIALGTLSTLAWARLDAIDVALVEAALGTGLTGALLMSSVAWARDPRGPPPRRSLARAAIVLAPVGGAVALGWLSFTAPQSGEELTPQVLAAMQPGGISHPVTAVLLDFRGYDTLLEVAVLLVAAVAVRAVQPVAPRRPTSAAPALLEVLAGLLVPVGIVFSGYLVWHGSHAPGGGFQGGAILAGCGVLLLLGSRMRAPALSSPPTRALLVLGPGLFVVLALLPLVAGKSLLEYPRAAASQLILALETALTISIAIILTMFFPGPRRQRADAPAGSEGRS